MQSRSLRANTAFCHKYNTLARSHNQANYDNHFFFASRRRRRRRPALESSSTGRPLAPPAVPTAASANPPPANLVVYDDATLRLYQWPAVNSRGDYLARSHSSGAGDDHDGDQRIGRLVLRLPIDLPSARSCGIALVARMQSIDVVVVVMPSADNDPPQPPPPPARGKGGGQNGGGGGGGGESGK
jgi:hypothetical protein